MARKKRGRSRNSNGRNGNGGRRGLKLLGGGGQEMDSVFGIRKSGVGKFFGGFNGNVRRSKDVGVQLPELGEGFNTRFGRVGSGFVERVDPDRFGFEGSGRSIRGSKIIGDIGRIGSGVSVLGEGKARGRKRGRKAKVVSTTEPKGKSIIDAIRERRARKKAEKESTVTTLEEVPAGESPIRALPSLEDISEDDMEKEMESEIEEEEEEPRRTRLTRGTLTDEEAAEQGIIR